MVTFDFTFTYQVFWDTTLSRWNPDVSKAPRVKRPGSGVDDPPSSNAEVKERVHIYLYPPPLRLQGLF